MLPGMVRVLVGAVVLLLSLTGVAMAQEAKPKKKSAAEGQENFGFGAGIGFVSPAVWCCAPARASCHLKARRASCRRCFRTAVSKIRS